MRRTIPFIFFFLLLPWTTPAVNDRWDAGISFVNFSAPQREKVQHAVRLIRKVIASDEFSNRVLNHTVRGKKTFVDNLGLSNEEIYQRITAGAEMVGETSRNGRMDIELELFHSPTKTIGYTYPDTNRIWINTKYFEHYTVTKVAHNLMHEWMHKLGFDHDKTHSASRDDSVPYAIGYLIEDLITKGVRQQ